MDSQSALMVVATLGILLVLLYLPFIALYFYRQSEYNYRRIRELLSEQLKLYGSVDELVCKASLPERKKLDKLYKIIGNADIKFLNRNEEIYRFYTQYKPT